MRSRLWLLLSLLVCATASLYVHRILDPWENYVDVDSGKLRVRLGDLYSPWLGSRELLLYGRNPYSAQVSHKIQMEFYGRAIEQSYDQPTGIIDEQRFAYPVYVVFLLSPTIRLDFVQAQRWTPPLLAALTAAGVLLWLDALRWRLSASAAGALILFVLSSPQIVQGLRLRQLGLLVGFLLALAAWCVTRNHLASAGMVLALSTIKPQMAILPLVWFLVWALGEWRERWRLLAGFLGGLAVLVGLGELVLPGWLAYFVGGLQAYRRYAPTTSLLRLAFGDLLGPVFLGVVALGLLGLAWRQRRCSANSRQFAVTLAAFLLAETITFSLLPPFNQVLLLLPALMVFKDWEKHPHFLRIAFALCLSWPWVASLTLLLVPTRTYSTNPLPLLPSFPVVFVPLLLLPFMATYRRNTC